MDSIDEETWSNEGGNPRERIELHERWYHYIVDESFCVFKKSVPLIMVVKAMIR